MASGGLFAMVLLAKVCRTVPAWIAAVVGVARDSLTYSSTSTITDHCAGLNVLLISRTESKLATASEEIVSKYRVKTKYCVVDFAHAEEGVWRKVATEVLALDVGILFNNVGLSYDHPEYFDQLSGELVRNIVETNITSVNEVRMAL